MEARLRVHALVTEDVLQQSLHSLPWQRSCVSLCHAPGLGLVGWKQGLQHLMRVILITAVLLAQLSQLASILEGGWLVGWVGVITAHPQELFDCSWATDATPSIIIVILLLSTLPGSL